MAINKKQNNKPSKQHALILRELNTVIEERFISYSKYIIQERALPDVRDGLKPVQRRILYAMNELKLHNQNQFKKSARVVGDVIGKYHPHGDSSVYEAMVRMAQDWKLNFPLIIMHGNKGSVDGDSPAAMRYTESKLSAICQLLLNDIEKNIVPFTANFDDTELEPVVLPTKFPNLLVNGSTGIASGYSTNIPPHNLTEILNAVVYMLDHQDYNLTNILNFVKGPDFPTGGTVFVNHQNLREIYHQGRGRILINCKYEVFKRDHEIHITELPFEVNKQELVKRIDELITNNKLPTLKAVRDDSDRNGLQITLILKSNHNHEVLMNYLFKNTDLQKSYNFNMVAIQDNKPVQLGLIDFLESFIDFQIYLYTNIYNYEVKNLLRKIEILEGLIRVLSVLDEVIALIRASKNKSDSINNLIATFAFSPLQAEAIVNLRLYRLSSTDIALFTADLKRFRQTIKHYQLALNNERILKDDIKANLLTQIATYNVARKTQISTDSEVDFSYNIEDLIKADDVYLTVSRQGYIKQVPLNSVAKSVNRVTGKRSEDMIIFNQTVFNKHIVTIFMKSGRYYSIPIFKLTPFRYSEVGEHISKHFNIGNNDHIIQVIINENDALINGRCLASTKYGLIKQMELKEFVYEFKKSGIKYFNLRLDDEVISLNFLPNDYYYVLPITDLGHILKYPLNQIPVVSLNTKGVKNIKLNDGDFVTETILLNQSANLTSQLLLVTKTGRGKRLKVSEITETKRAQIGRLIIRHSQTKINHLLFAMLLEQNNLALTLITDDNRQIALNPKKNLPLVNFENGLSKIIDEQLKMYQLDNLISITLNQKWIDNLVTIIVPTDEEEELLITPELFEKSSTIE